ncbi:MAG: glyceraldehyde 3-phosphate dehydrogenase NAD-binding domain-containing protein, partial [Mammaliicoccus vitulinus]
MKKNIAINGLGRIGRMVLRGSLKSDYLNIVAINASYPPETIAHLIKYDSTHGKLDGDIEAVEDGIVINGHKILL